MNYVIHGPKNSGPGIIISRKHGIWRFSFFDRRLQMGIVAVAAITKRTAMRFRKHYKKKDF